MHTYTNEAIKLRRQLHMIPETGFEEHKTSEFIRSYLKNLGYKPITTAKTGVYTFCDFQKEDTVLFRCDIDALPVTEETSLGFASVHPGNMHACGHDGHMAMMLTFAKYLAENEVNPDHNVILLFQPAEENPGGAKYVIEEGIIEKYNVRRAYSLHLSPSHGYGRFHAKSGEFFASGVELYITVTGKASHGASPHSGKDAILAGCALVSALHTIVSRDLNPIHDGVITIGTINGGSAMNVIADTVRLSGTLRAFNNETKELMLNRVREVCMGIGLTYGVDVKFSPVYCYPPLINDEKLFIEAKSILGDNLAETDKVMMSEDFSYFAEKIPSLMMFLGTDDGKEEHQYPLHSPKFDFDDSVLIKGVEAFVNIVKKI
ncbi:MAG: amidohydrolase [Anaerofustis stercorihominis]|nr:amidohydrolase [Anaerofustis stercorihominis]